MSTPLLVEQDEEGLVMRYRLAPRGEGCGHLNALEGCWHVMPGAPCVRWRDGGGEGVYVCVWGAGGGGRALTKAGKLFQGAA